MNTPHPPSHSKSCNVFDRLYSPRRSKHFTVPDERENVVDSFGKSTPHITIGSSRNVLPEEPRSPGPCAYDTFEYVVTTPRYTLKSRPEVDYSTDTSNIDIPNIRVYPRKLEKHIGKRGSTDFWRKSDTPAGNLKHETLYKPKITIHKRPVERIRQSPGPCDYNPSDKRNFKLLSFPRQRDKSPFDVRRSKSPSPDSYNIDRSLIGKEKWKGKIRPIKVWDYGEND